MEKDSFVFRKEWRDAISGLPDEVRLEIYEAIIEYGTSGKSPDLKPMAMLAFNFAKVTLDKDLKKYADIVDKRKKAGRKGGAPSGNDNAARREEQEKTSKTSKTSICLHDKQNKQNKQMRHVYDSVSDSVIVDDNKAADAAATRGVAPATPADAAAAAAESSPQPDVDFAAVKDYWNRHVDTAGGQTRKLTLMTAPRRQLLRRCLDTCGGDMDMIYTAIDRYFSGAYLRGKSWATFEWLFGEENFGKVLDGNYETVAGAGTEDTARRQPDRESSISRSIRERREHDAEPQESADERLKRQLEGWVRLVNKNPKSSVRKALEEYERRGELRRLGVAWEPLLHQEPQE